MQPKSPADQGDRGDTYHLLAGPMHLQAAMSGLCVSPGFR